MDHGVLLPDQTEPGVGLLSHDPALVDTIMSLILPRQDRITGGLPLGRLATRRIHVHSLVHDEGSPGIRVMAAAGSRGSYTAARAEPSGGGCTRRG